MDPQTDDDRDDTPGDTDETGDETSNTSSDLDEPFTLTADEADAWEPSFW